MKQTNKAKNLKLDTSQKGQALLFVVVAMTIALSIGINASVRTITSLSRTTRTDTAARALAAAEGGVERFMALPTQELERAVKVTEGTSTDCPVGYIDGLTMDQGGMHSYDHYCVVSFDAPTPGDMLTSQAFVIVERYDQITSYPFSLEAGQVKEINLYDFTDPPIDKYYTDDSDELDICWSPESDPTDLMYIAYSKDGIEAKGGLKGDLALPGPPYNTQGFDWPPDGARPPDYDHCYTVNITSNDVYGLRIRSLGGDSNVAIFSAAGTELPLQGYRITSIGKLEQDQTVVATRIIRIIRTLPYLPLGFDYALYSEAAISK